MEYEKMKTEKVWKIERILTKENCLTFDFLSAIEIQQIRKENWLVGRDMYAQDMKCSIEGIDYFYTIYNIYPVNISDAEKLGKNIQTQALARKYFFPQKYGKKNGKAKAQREKF